jgi:succinyl-CoA synthetase alpha subunit
MPAHTLSARRCDRPYAGSVSSQADTTADKIERMQAAGISVAERIEDIPALLKERLKGH